MPLHFNWTQELSVDDPVLDGQHQLLLEQVNRLLDALAGEIDLTALHETVDFLDRYIAEHFTSEEAYMRRHAYPELSIHQEMHQRFTLRYEQLKERLFKTGPSEELLISLENDLARWWVDHIGNADKKYAVYIRELNAASEELQA